MTILTAPAQLSAPVELPEHDLLPTPLPRRPHRRRGWLVRRALVLADLAGLTAAFLAVSWVYGSFGPAGRVGAEGEYVLFAASLPLWVLIARLHGLYDRDEERADHPTTDDVVGVFHLVTICTWLFLAASLLTGLADPEIGKLLGFWLAAILIVPLARSLARRLCRRSRSYVQRAVIVGAGDVGQLIARKLMRHPEYGIEVLGFVDGNPRVRRADLPEKLAILGSPARLRDVIEDHGVDRVIVSFCSEETLQTLAAVRMLGDLEVQVDIVPRLFELVGPRVDIHTVEGLPLIGLPPARPGTSARLIKRAIDVVLAATMLLVTAPLFAYIALRIRLDSTGPVLFRQTRLGIGMREFTALKFRTMRVGVDPLRHQEFIRATMSAGAEAPASGIYKLETGDAGTRFGRWLRKTSLDELPQLINVLKGDMSLVGPRPCIPYETDHFRPHQFERFLVPQGLTGLWQVTARANATFGEALDMDVAYARGWSLGLDLRLMLRTPGQILRQRQATA
jgi:exopolysaccharide biosynthesis polyprenyl glycosylphosphotransferase